jgi:hypothetical protein
MVSKASLGGLEEGIINPWALMGIKTFRALCSLYYSRYNNCTTPNSCRVQIKARISENEHDI